MYVRNASCGSCNAPRPFQSADVVMRTNVSAAERFGTPARLRWRAWCPPPSCPPVRRRLTHWPELAEGVFESRVAEGRRGADIRSAASSYFCKSLQFLFSSYCRTHTDYN